LTTAASPGWRAAEEGLAHETKRPEFVGEYGLTSKAGETATRVAFEKLFADLEATEMDLAAFWVFDLRSQGKDGNVTFQHDRSWMLELAASQPPLERRRAPTAPVDRTHLRLELCRAGIPRLSSTRHLILLGTRAFSGAFSARFQLCSSAFIRG